MTGCFREFWWAWILWVGLPISTAGLLAAETTPAKVTAPVAASEARRVSEHFFTQEIRPILAAKCFACHGAGTAESGLRFTSADELQKKPDSGKLAVIPGDPDRSELIRRISSSDERMPPKGEPLSPAQIQAMRRWIADGALWTEHWAYAPLTDSRPRVSDPIAETCQSPIDEFIRARLAAEQMASSPPADPRTLIRRAYLDLTGLPPDPDEVERFAAETTPDAFDRLLDRLLASPRLGERSARIWMDVVHYAETHGHDQDRPREHAWPYRDYLIRRFNEDQPYSRFVAEQIAGDRLFPGDPWALVGTGFLATGPWDESSLRDIREDTLDREIARYLDRDDMVTTVLSTFSSTTIHCARCHDHKFDPITQADYYALQAVFAATDKANREYDPDPGVARRRTELAAALENVRRQRDANDAAILTPDLRRRVDEWEASLGNVADRWQPLHATENSTTSGGKLRTLEDGSLLAEGARADKDTYTIQAPVPLRTITAIRVEVLTDPSLPHNGPGRQDNGNLHLNEFTAKLSGQPLKIASAKADFDQAGWVAAMSIDGNPGTAWGIFPEVGKPHQIIYELEQPVDAAETGSGRPIVSVELHQIHGGGHLIGRPRISVTSAPLPLSPEPRALPEAVRAVLQTPVDQRSVPQNILLAAYVAEQDLRRESESLPKPQLVYCGTNQFRADGSFRPATEPRMVQVLARGEITQPKAVAKPHALTMIPRLVSEFTELDQADEGRRRMALARWLTDPKNVLTWRSIANRIWQQHLDRAIVETPNDFGQMGGQPSHPELLNWLASELVREPIGAAEAASGVVEFGSLKRLHRRIMLSATYRQATVHNPDWAQRDADNRLLWRMNRRRLDAESVRDSVLLAAGMLDLQMGGPSVRQFIQSPGIHVTPSVDYQSFDVAAPANRRRSVYRFVFRTLPDPFMDALDCPDASQLTAKRSSSLTALVALAMLNDKHLLHACEVLAADVERAPRDVEPKLVVVFRKLLGRTPTEAEAQLLTPYLERHGPANLARLLINSNEFMFVE